MYVFQETINGRKLTDLINELHENVKYLPGIKLPESVVNIGKCVQYQLKFKTKRYFYFS